MKCFHLSHIYILEPPSRSPKAPCSPVAVSPLPTSLGRMGKRDLGMIIVIWIIYLYDTIAHGYQYRKRLCGIKCFGGWSYFSQPWGKGGLSIHRHARRFHQCLSPLLGQHLVFWAGWFCIILLFSVEMICLILNFIALKSLYVIDASRLN